MRSCLGDSEMWGVSGVLLVIAMTFDFLGIFTLVTGVLFLILEIR